MNPAMIYPEMGETTTAQIEYNTCYGGKFYLTTDLQLSGQGIKQIDNGENHARNKKTFYATHRAMHKLRETYTTCYIALL